jgi:hypothetical protein
MTMPIVTAPDELVFARKPAGGGRCPKRGEKAGGEKDHVETPRLSAARQVDARRSLAVQVAAEVLDLASLRAPVVEIDRRDGRLKEIGRPIRGVDRIEPIGIRKRQRPQHHGVHDREDRGVRADAEGERQNRGGRKARRRGQPPQRVLNVVSNVPHEIPPSPAALGPPIDLPHVTARVV